MKLRIKRIILFVRDMERVARFYREILGLVPINDQAAEGWLEFDGGGCSLALHRGGPGRRSSRGSKIVFWAGNVAAARRRLVRRGAALGEVKVFGNLQLCDGKDPEGNAFQISNRR